MLMLYETEWRRKVALPKSERKQPKIEGEGTKCLLRISILWNKQFRCADKQKDQERYADASSTVCEL